MHREGKIFPEIRVHTAPNTVVTFWAGSFKSVSSLLELFLNYVRASARKRKIVRRHPFVLFGVFPWVLCTMHNFGLCHVGKEAIPIRPLVPP